MVKNLLIQLKIYNRCSKNCFRKSNLKARDLIRNKIADKITSVSKKSKKSPKDGTEEDVELTTHKKDTYLQKKDNKLLMN